MRRPVRTKQNAARDRHVQAIRYLALLLVALGFALFAFSNDASPLVSTLLAVPAGTLLAAQTEPRAVPDEVVQHDDPRVESALQMLATDEERAGQLLMLGWTGSVEEAGEMMSQLRPGAVVQIQNARLASDAARLNAAILSLAHHQRLLTPLLAVDHEGGRVQRVQDVQNVGPNWEFGLTAPSDLDACERGRFHARQLRDMGFTMNLAPVLDVNNNPDNPVIGSRSYGSDPETVARLGSRYITGLQGGGVAATGKHFPGHGNTSVDSHLSLPVLQQTERDLDQVELIPFRRAIQEPTRVAAIMSAHIAFPAVDLSGAPATLSRPIMTGLLRDRLGFDGLVLSDDMGVMKAIVDNYSPGESALRAIDAGVDMLVIAGPIERQLAARDALVYAVRTGALPAERVAESLRRVLRVKARFGLLGEPGPAISECM